MADPSAISDRFFFSPFCASCNVFVRYLTLKLSDQSLSTYPELPTNQNLIGAASKTWIPIISFSIVDQLMKYFNGFLIPERPSQLRFHRSPFFFSPRSLLTYFRDQHWQEIAAITKCGPHSIGNGAENGWDDRQPVLVAKIRKA
jgi:hypothetical protein